MTPKEMTLAMQGYRQAEKARWARALRISQHLNDSLTVDKLFSGAQRQPMTREKYQDLKERMGYTNGDA